MHRTALTCSSIASLTLLALSAMLAFGPLNPPGGPVAPTTKPLSEVEPRIAVNATNTPGDADSLFKITQPGSYYLTGNVTGVAGKHGIEIVASGVTLDLNGFDLEGVAGMGAFDGVAVTVGGLNSIAVLNGSVRNWGGDGVDLPVTNSRVAGVRARGNTEDGITVGNAVAISDCTASGNTLMGIRTGSDCTVVGCIGYQNGNTGILIGNGSLVSNCTANSNSSTGIVTGNGCHVGACTALGNSANGIFAGTNCTVSGCTASSNALRGINVPSGCTVADCTVKSNALDGINCSSQSLITNNLVTANGVGVASTANIHLTLSDNRVEGNNLSSGNNGLLVDVAGNVIVRNTASGNTINWVIAANNVFGPIVDRTAPGSAAVSGNAAASSLGSTDPNANFTY